MRLHSWTTLGLFAVIASAFPVQKSQEIHLPYFPNNADDAVESYLSLTWLMANGSLYANGDRVFPPSLSMQLHAQRYESASDTLLDRHDVQLAYSLEARPLSAEEVGATTNIVRVSVELLDLNGLSVSSSAVVIDMYAHPRGSHHLTRIRVTPARGIAGGRPHEPSSKADSDSSHAYIHSPFWDPVSRPPPHQRRPHHPPHHPHGYRRSHSFLELIRPVIIPVMMGAIAGLTTCVVGYFMGQVLVSLWRQLAFTKDKKQSSRSRVSHVEDGTVSEKSCLIPEITVTETDPEED